MKRIVITGATSGIGKETALALANDSNNEIIISARNEQKAIDTLKEIKNITGNKNLHYFIADFSSLQEVKNMGVQIKEKFEHLDILINNAGFLAAEKKITIDGLEETLAVNHFAPFLLTKILLDNLKGSEESRIINVSSAAHRMIQKVDFSDLIFESNKWHYFQVYALSKLFNIYFTKVLAEQLKGSNISTNCLHPGVIYSNFGQSSKPYIALFYKLFSLFMKNNKQGAETTIYLASSDKVKGVTGKYFSDSKISNPTKLALNMDNAKKLWQISEKICSKF
jgi:NAD(P)-dependent dehydrogenase (short-subunit alcohol dehydrogenase family)